jgi:hypothetical protein
MPFHFRVAVTGQGGVRPSEVMSVLFPEAPISARIVRTFMGYGTLDPLLLEALRERERATAGEADVTDAAANAHEDVADGPDEAQACE